MSELTPAAEELVVIEVDALTRAVARAIKSTTAPLEEKIKLLTTRLEIQEGKPPALHDKGVWQVATYYDAGAVVSYQGSAWAAKTTHTSGTSFNHAQWRMLFKSGQR